MTMFNTLMRAIYALDGADGEFLADLTRPVPSHRGEDQEGTLARIPATLHSRLVDSIEWHETAISEEIAFAMEDRDDYSQESLVEILTDLDSPSYAVEHVRSLRLDLRALRLELAAL